MAWRLGAIILAIAISAGLTWIKIGALLGTYDANLRARAAMLLRQPALRSASTFPDLAEAGTDYAQISTPEGGWLSPSLARLGGSRLPDAGDKLMGVSLPGGSTGLAVSVRDDAALATYASGNVPYRRDLVRLIGVPALLIVAPTVALALLAPRRRYALP